MALFVSVPAGASASTLARSESVSEPVRSPIDPAGLAVLQRRGAERGVRHVVGQLVAHDDVVRGAAGRLDDQLVADGRAGRHGLARAPACAARSSAARWRRRRRRDERTRPEARRARPAARPGGAGGATGGAGGVRRRRRRRRGRRRRRRRGRRRRRRRTGFGQCSVTVLIPPPLHFAPTTSVPERPGHVCVTALPLRDGEGLRDAVHRLGRRPGSG